MGVFISVGLAVISWVCPQRLRANSSQDKAAYPRHQHAS